QSAGGRYISTDGALTLGLWTHVAVTVSGNRTGTFFVNGMIAGTFASTIGDLVTASNQPLTIANQAGGSMRFVGGIDDVAVYSYSLTPEQIAWHVAAVPLLARQPTD